MISAVLDTNTFISAMLFPSGVPGRILTLARNRRFTLVTATPILTETMRVLTYPHIQQKYRISQHEIERLRRFFQRRAVITKITADATGVATHPEDDLILATADSAGADYLVTGDRQLQRIGTYKGVRIVNPRHFLDVLESSQDKPEG